MESSFASESTGAVRLELDGQFNPMILQPLWLKTQGLIDDDDLSLLQEEDSTHFIVSSDFTGIELSWATIEVTRDSCEISSGLGTDTPSRVRELALGLFEHLPHTPVASGLIDHSRHFKLSSDAWTRIAERAAPSAPFEEGLGASHLESLERRVSKEGGSLAFLLEPSRLPGYTLYVSVGRMMDFEDGNAHVVAEWVSANWDDARETAEGIMRAVISWESETD